MSATTVQCKCKNLEVTGSLLPPGVYPHIANTERTRLSACTSVYSVAPRSLTIRTFREVNFQAHGHSCVDLYCTGCKTAFRFFAGSPTAYMGELPESRRRDAGSPSGVNPLGREMSLALLPPIIQGIYFARPPPPEPRKPKSHRFDDPDFELMFSSPIVPIVGSCRARAELMGEFALTGGGGWGPLGVRSYY
jgi:hypothetical protein